MDLFGSVDFKAMESGFKALSMKQQVIAQNLANQDTPDYKQKEFSFKNVLANSVDGKPKAGDEYNFQANIFEDTSRNILMDGNSVDTDQQQLELYETYLQHSALVQKISGTFSRLEKVCQANM
jgi:flagellar basal-body rod protein FlgB